MDTKVKSSASGLTETERANQLFLKRVQRLPGILRVERYGGQTLGEQAFTVYVREADLDTPYAVYDLEREIYASYPHVRLDVSVFEEAEEPGGEPVLHADSP
jgi:hypothetical protein